LEKFEEMLNLGNKEEVLLLLKDLVPEWERKK